LRVITDPAFTAITALITTPTATLSQHGAQGQGKNQQYQASLLHGFNPVDAACGKSLCPVFI
jgi:hypothetical protein